MLKLYKRIDGVLPATKHGRWQQDHRALGRGGEQGQTAEHKLEKNTDPEAVVAGPRESGCPRVRSG